MKLIENDPTALKKMIAEWMKKNTELLKARK